MKRREKVSRLRTKDYTDIYMTDSDVKWLKKGYSITKCITKDGKACWFSIKTSSDRKSQRKIDKLLAEIKGLKKGKRGHG